MYDLVEKIEFKVRQAHYFIRQREILLLVYLVKRLLREFNILPGTPRDIMFGRQSRDSNDVKKFPLDSDLVVTPLRFPNVMMYLDIHDGGVSNDLFYSGAREGKISRIFEQEVKSLTHELQSVQILEIGCNIGYYLMIECNILDDKDHIYAFEPDPRNAEIARKNIELNGFEHLADVYEYAIGADSDITSFNVHHSHSNWGHISEVDRTPNESDPHPSKGDDIEVKVISIDNFIKDRKISASDINVIRMDIEGYEYEALRGMETVLQEADALLLNIEVHTQYLDKDKIDYIINTLSNYQFEVLDGIGIEELDGIRDVDIARVILRKC